MFLILKIKHFAFSIRVSLITISMAMSQIAHAEFVTLPLLGIGTDESGAVLLQFGAGNFNPCGCLVIAGSNPGVKSMLATAMLAQAQKLPVSVNRAGRSPGPWGISDYATELRLAF